MPDEFEVAVDNIREELTPTPRGEIVRVKVVEFHVGQSFGHTVRIPAEQFTPEAVESAVRAEADKLRAIFKLRL